MRKGIAVALLCASLAGPGCKTEGAGAPSKETAPTPAQATGEHSITANAVDHAAHFIHAPAGAQVVVTFDMAALWTNAIDHNFGIIPVKKAPTAVREAMSKASVQSLGFDITAATVVTAWGSFSPATGPSIAVHFGGVQGSLKAKKTRTHEGVDIVSFAGLSGASLESGLLIGLEPALVQAIDVAKGKQESLSKSGADAHTSLLTSIQPGSFTLTAVLGPLAMLAPEPFKGLEGAAVSITPEGLFTTIAKGKSETLDVLMANVQQAQQMAKAQLEAAYAEAVKDSSALLLPLTYAVEKWEDFVSYAKPIRKDNRVIMSTNVGGLGGASLPMLGIVTAVAVPSFIKYMRRIKTAEANVQLDMLVKSAGVYFSTPQVEPTTGVKRGCEFPKSQPLTPAPVNGKHPCCSPSAHDADGDERCDGNADLWNTPTWSALNMKLSSPHYFMYEFESNEKTGQNAQFTARAYADLDCDGVFSTFERVGYGANGCALGQTTNYVENETE